VAVTPIKKGTAQRLGLRKPQPAEPLVVPPNVEALLRAMEGIGEVMRQGEERLRQNWAHLVKTTHRP